MKNVHVTVLSSVVALSLSACAAQSGTVAESPASKTASESSQSAATKDAAPRVAEKKAPPPTAAKLVFQLEHAGFAAPEAVLYDAEQDVYFVSNVNGDPLATDHNGFISKVSPDGKLLELKFIDGAQAKTSLDAPKGMAISGDILYVSDITWVRMFDRKTGAPRGKLFAKGATFLNDMTTDEEGVVYVSDTGWKSGEDGFTNTGTDTVFRIDPKKVATEALISDKGLGNPNGLITNKEGLWAVNGGGELFRLNEDGKKDPATKLAKGGLDGVVALEDGTFLVSSWEASAIYRGTPGGEFLEVVSELKSPADIGYDSKRNLLLVPSMNEDRMLAYELNGDEGTVAAVAPAASSPEAETKSKGKGATRAEPATLAKPDEPASTSEAASSAMAETKPAAKTTPQAPAKKGAAPAPKK